MEAGEELTDEEEVEEAKLKGPHNTYTKTAGKEAELRRRLGAYLEELNAAALPVVSS